MKHCSSPVIGWEGVGRVRPGMDVFSVSAEVCDPGGVSDVATA